MWNSYWYCGLWIWRQQHQWADVKKATILHKRLLLETGKYDITTKISILLTSKTECDVVVVGGCWLLAALFYVRVFFFFSYSHDSKKSTTTNPKQVKLTLIPYYYYSRTNIMKMGKKKKLIFFFLFVHWDKPSINITNTYEHYKIH